jgi:hypothetical protein
MAAISDVMPFDNDDHPFRSIFLSIITFITLLSLLSLYDDDDTMSLSSSLSRLIDD